MDLVLFIFFLFYFYFWFFILFFFILNLGKECDVILYIMVTQVTKHDRSVTSVTVIGHSYIIQIRM